MERELRRKINQMQDIYAVDGGVMDLWPKVRIVVEILKEVAHRREQGTVAWPLIPTRKHNAPRFPGDNHLDESFARFIGMKNKRIKFLFRRATKFEP